MAAMIAAEASCPQDVLLSGWLSSVLGAPPKEGRRICAVGTRDFSAGIAGRPLQAVVKNDLKARYSDLEAYDFLSQMEDLRQLVGKLEGAKTSLLVWTDDVLWASRVIAVASDGRVGAEVQKWSVVDLSLRGLLRWCIRGVSIDRDVLLYLSEWCFGPGDVLELTELVEKLRKWCKERGRSYLGPEDRDDLRDFCVRDVNGSLQSLWEGMSEDQMVVVRCLAGCLEELSGSRSALETSRRWPEVERSAALQRAQATGMPEQFTRGLSNPGKWFVEKGLLLRFASEAHQAFARTMLRRERGV